MRITAVEPPAGLVIIGHPVAHSLSPVFQQAALDACGIDMRYQRMDVDRAMLGSALEKCRGSRTGGNVTIPHKEAVALAADRLSDTARRTGAVNTFWFESGLLVGHNTDVLGARLSIEALLRERKEKLQQAVILGSGGAAAAVLLALAEISAAGTTIVARGPARAQALLDRLGLNGMVCSPGSAEAQDALASASLVVNTTPLGLNPADELPADPAGFHSRPAVFDLVYRPPASRGEESITGRTAIGGTAFTRAALARDLVARDGLAMLVEQGAEAFRCWFGVEPPKEIMWAALGGKPPLP